MQETQEMQVWFLGQEDPLEEEMEPTTVFLPGKFQSLIGYSPQGGEELDTTEHARVCMHTHTVTLKCVSLPPKMWFILGVLLDNQQCTTC